MKHYLLFILLIVSLLTKAQTICIDPGHGYGPEGEDLDGRTYEEITTNCAVGLILRDSLESRGYVVIMTREDSDSGSWMSLTQRAELADEYESDRLLSIHCNAGGGTGTETFWCYVNSPNRAIDSTFSFLVQNSMSYLGEWRSRRSIEDLSYLGFHLGVLKGTAPGCLNEIGFVDTSEDLVKLLDEDWRKIFAQAYRLAIEDSFNQVYPSRIIKIENQFMEVYPLPFDSYILVEQKNGMLSVNSIELLDVTGIRIKRILTEEISQNKFIIDTSDLPHGAYFLRVNSAGKSYSRAVVK